MEETILTVEQVAHVLQVHPFTVLKFIKQGRLKAAKLGRVYRIRRSDVDKFIDDLANGKVVAPESNQPKKAKSESKAKKPSPKDVSHAPSLTDESKEVPFKEEAESHKDNDRNHEDHYVIDFTF
jgi:excisionase family DNA binding protein